MTEGFVLRLHGVPPDLMIDLLATLDGLQREVQMANLDADGPAAIGQAAHDALVSDRGRVEGPRNVILDQATAARAAGHQHVDITAAYEAEAIAPFLSARVGVAEADAAARRGELLAGPMAPEERRLWSWVGVEFETQAAGGPATPFATADRAG
ncbi:MAG TPA: hypothetical protein VF228_00725 [Iamia sp.]